MVHEHRRIHVIANPAAGQDRPVLGTLNNIFREHGFGWSLDVTNAYGDGERFARQAINEGADLILAYGGDGTVSDVVNGMVGCEVPFSILPGVTGNVLAQGFGIPADLSSALKQILKGRTVTVDLGKMFGRHFMLRADLGISSASVSDTTRDLKQRFGVLAYLINAVQKLRDAVPLVYKLTIDGQPFEREAMTCFVTNMNEVGILNLTFSHEVRSNDGLLDVILIENIPDTVAGITAEIARLQVGAASGFQHWQGKQIHIETTLVQKVRGDGENMGQTPVDIDVVPGAVQVLVPA